MSSKPYVLSTLLDPRFKGKYMRQETFTEGKTMLLQEIKRISKEQLEQDNKEIRSKIDGKDEEDGEPASKKKKPQSLQEDIHVDFSSCYDDPFGEKEEIFFIEEGVENTKMPKVPFSVLAAELEGYINMPKIQRNENPFVWWEQHESSFPRISQLAKQYLSMPASSVCSERLFSEAGNILKRRGLDSYLEMVKNCSFSTII